MDRRHTILVVDDEPDVVKSVQDLLRFDYRVLGATSARDGLEIMEHEDVHVIMTDQRMPEMTGVELLHRVRESHPETIRLLFTGYADIRAVIDAINQGSVYRYIAKPWEPDELLVILREAVERYDLIVERRTLTDELKRKNVELEQANTELREANELKTAFIKVASHELRTPLAILTGILALARREPAGDKLRDLMARLDENNGRLRRLVNQLLEMLVANDPARPLVTERTDVCVLLSRAANDVQPFVELRHQQLVVEPGPDVGTIEVDALKIRDVINNLLFNAIKFTPDGGTITAAARRVDGGAVIEVKDTGVGLPKEVLNRLGEPFFTGFDVSRHASGTFEFGRQGLGLGLSQVKAFVSLHGGRLDVVSEPGSGSTFTVFLPAHPPAERKAA